MRIEGEVECLVQGVSAQRGNAEVQMCAAAVPGVPRRANHLPRHDALTFGNRNTAVRQVQVLADRAVGMSNPDVIRGGAAGGVVFAC